MRLKHFLYSITILCALAEIGMALYAMHWGSILEEIALAEHIQPDSEMLVVKALNIALPSGLCSMALLIYTWKIDSIGAFALFMAGALHMIGFDLNARAVKKVYGNGTPLADVTWWAPAEKPAAQQTVVNDQAS